MNSNTRLFVIAGLLVGLALALFVSPFASSSPDGLEKVAAEAGFDGAAEASAVADSPPADYGVEGVDDDRAGTAISGLIGVLATFGVGVALFGVVRVLRPATPGDTARPEPSSA